LKKTNEYPHVQLRGHEKTIIGWSEPVAFPDWEIPRINAKIDTGARTSALHVEDIETAGPDEVRFHVILSRKHAHRRVEVVAPVLKWARVRSSTGHFTKRCFVKTRIQIGHIEKEIELSLVSREKMIYRMLLGRKALQKDFLVDVTRKHTLGLSTRRRERS
jgi:hypothetical protein